MSCAYFVVVIVYKSSSPAPDYLPLYEETFSLIRAESADAARARALVLAGTRAATFVNHRGQETTWELHQIVDISPILQDDIGEVTALYSRRFQDFTAYQAIDPLS